LRSLSKDTADGLRRGAGDAGRAVPSDLSCRLAMGGSGVAVATHGDVPGRHLGRVYTGPEVHCLGGKGGEVLLDHSSRGANRLVCPPGVFEGTVL